VEYWPDIMWNGGPACCGICKYLSPGCTAGVGHSPSHISKSLTLTTRAGSQGAEAQPDLNQCRPKDEINLATTGTVGEAPQGLGSLRGLKFTVLRTRSLALSQWSWVGAKLRDTRR
jgi:hypothetical protein